MSDETETQSALLQTEQEISALLTKGIASDNDVKKLREKVDEMYRINADAQKRKLIVDHTNLEKYIFLTEANKVLYILERATWLTDDIKTSIDRTTHRATTVVKQLGEWFGVLEKQPNTPGAISFEGKRSDEIDKLTQEIEANKYFRKKLGDDEFEVYGTHGLPVGDGIRLYSDIEVINDLFKLQYTYDKIVKEQSDTSQEAALKSVQGMDKESKLLGYISMNPALFGISQDQLTEFLTKRCNAERAGDPEGSVSYFCKGLSGQPGQQGGWRKRTKHKKNNKTHKKKNNKRKTHKKKNNKRKTHKKKNTKRKTHKKKNNRRRA